MAKSLAERIEALIDSASSLWAAEELTEILADVRELESLLCEIVFDDEVTGGRWPSTMERARAILSRTSETKEST